MSLVGNLEDLGLGDILQIVSLSRKSGVLNLGWGEVHGKIIFKDGQVVSAVSSAGQRTLGSLLAEHGLISPSRQSELERRIASEPDWTRIRKLLSDDFNLSPAVVEEAIREQIESTAFHFFTWPEGTFSFDLQEIEDELKSLEPAQRAFVLEPGLSPQFLAMEGTRLQDEQKRDRFDSPVGPALKFSEQGAAAAGPATQQEPASSDDAGEPVPRPSPGPAEVEEDFSSVSEALAFYESQAKQKPAPEPSPDTALNREDSPPVTGEPAPAATDSPSAAEPQITAPPGLEPAPEKPRLDISRPDLIIVDDDPLLLASLVHHLGQKQYQVRTFTEIKAALQDLQTMMDMGIKPRAALADLIMPGSDRASTLGGLELLERSRKINPSLSVYLMTDYENQSAQKKAEELGARFFFTKPKSSQLDEDYGSPELLNFVQVLVSALESEKKREPGAAPAAGAESPLVDLGDELRREFGEEVKPLESEEAGKITPSRGLQMLKTMISELNDPGSNGQITLLILRFAAELMNRAIIFLVAKNRLAGLGQFGLELDGVDPQKHVRQIRIPLNQPSIFREAIQKRMPLKKALKSTEWNDYLVETLGGVRPAEVFVAPIIAGGKIAALIYGDNAPEQKEIGDTESLEIFLAQAGLAMEKALLEMRLREIEKPGSDQGGA